MEWDAIFTAYPDDADSIQSAKNIWESLRQSIDKLEMPTLDESWRDRDVFDAIPADKLARICQGVRNGLYPESVPVDMQQALNAFLGQGEPADLPEDLADEIRTLLHSALILYLTRLREHNTAFVPAEWQAGACPFCSSYPHMAFDSEENRTLHCPLCGQAWIFPRVQCPVCGNSDFNTLGYFEAEGLEGYKVAFCKECNHYIKVVDTRQRTTCDAATEDVLTAELDALAAQEGFSRSG